MLGWINHWTTVGLVYQLSLVDIMMVKESSWSSMELPPQDSKLALDFIDVLKHLKYLEKFLEYYQGHHHMALPTLTCVCLPPQNSVAVYMKQTCEEFHHLLITLFLAYTWTLQNVSGISDEAKATAFYGDLL